MLIVHFSFVSGTPNNFLYFSSLFWDILLYTFAILCKFCAVKYECWFICKRHMEGEVSSGTRGRKHTFHKWTVNFFPISAPLYSGTLEQVQWVLWMFQTGCHWTPAILKGHRVKKIKNLCFGRNKVTLSWQSNQ